jgi:hypothetical protein
VQGSKLGGTRIAQGCPSMRPTLLCLAGVSLLVAAEVQAQAKWPGEVTSFRGVGIGQRLDGIPECLKRLDQLKKEEYVPYYDYPAQLKDSVCWKATTDTPLIRTARAVTLSNLPFIKGAGREAMATLIDGAVESIEVRFLGPYADTFRLAFIEKYGAPSAEVRRTYQNKMGATFEGQALTWRGAQVTLTLEPYFETTDFGLMAMRSKKFDAAIAAETKTTTESVKKGL